jgi:hypothetical protein
MEQLSEAEKHVLELMAVNDEELSVLQLVDLGGYMSTYVIGCAVNRLRSRGLVISRYGNTDLTIYYRLTDKGKGMAGK